MIVSFLSKDLQIFFSELYQFEREKNPFENQSLCLLTCHNQVGKAWDTFTPLLADLMLWIL